jgi:hypothetical protein
VIQGEQFEAEIAPSKLVMFFDVSEETLIRRCMKRAETSGRADDNIGKLIVVYAWSIFEFRDNHKASEDLHDCHDSGCYAL